MVGTCSIMSVLRVLGASDPRKCELRIGSAVSGYSEDILERSEGRHFIFIMFHRLRYLCESLRPQLLRPGNAF